VVGGPLSPARRAAGKASLTTSWWARVAWSTWSRLPEYPPALLESGRRRAQAEGRVVTLQQTDAEKLPFADSAFDAVVSTFDVLFTPDQRQAARELAHVCWRKATARPIACLRCRAGTWRS
jgi:ubiquinone/menaquinone biosynthesis C-methylase UbiE